MVRHAGRRDHRGSTAAPGSIPAPGYPQTGVAHVTERFTRRTIGTMDIDITINDPKAYVKPWIARVPVNLLPDSDLIETFCENEKDVNRMFREPLTPHP